MSPALASGFSTTSTTWEAQHMDLGKHKHPLLFYAFNSLKTICLIYKYTCTHSMKNTHICRFKSCSHLIQWANSVSIVHTLWAENLTYFLYCMSPATRKVIGYI